MAEILDSIRSRLFAHIISSRLDEEQRRVIEGYADSLDFDPIEDLMISAVAWNYAAKIGMVPELVFAHPDILQAHPKTSLYYRGMTLLSRKRVQQAATSVTDWETGKKTVVRRRNAAVSVARLYNAIISSIIEGSTDWTLENGYRNILATMAITLDGMYRNKIGAVAEEFVKGKIVASLKSKGLISQEEPENQVYALSENTIMRYGSEPDIEFRRNERLIATIEIKGGTDPAGALERLGSMSKSFAETPRGCVNFLVAGVITPQMQTRLDGMGDVKCYRLDRLSEDEGYWDDFTNEIFHHAVRVI